MTGAAICLVASTRDDTPRHRRPLGTPPAVPGAASTVAVLRTLVPPAELVSIITGSSVVGSWTGSTVNGTRCLCRILLNRGCGPLHQRPVAPRWPRSPPARRTPETPTQTAASGEPCATTDEPAYRPHRARLDSRADNRHRACPLQPSRTMTRLDSPTPATLLEAELRVITWLLSARAACCAQSRPARRRATTCGLTSVLCRNPARMLWRTQQEPAAEPEAPQPAARPHSRRRQTRRRGTPMSGAPAEGDSGSPSPAPPQKCSRPSAVSIAISVLNGSTSVKKDAA